MSQFSSEIRNAFMTWSIANILGFSIPPLIMFLVPSLTAISGLLSTTLLISMPLSITQWAALRRTLPVSILWIFSIPASILVLVLIVREMPESYWGFVDLESLAALIAISFLIGLMIGLPQWLILRRKSAQSSIWLLGSALGLGLGASIVIATDLVNISGILAYIIAVLIYIIATGITLSWLVMHREQPEEPVINPV